MRKLHIITILALIILQGCSKPVSTFSGNTSATEKQKELISKGILEYLVSDKGCKSIEKIDVQKDNNNRENWNIYACGAHTLFSVKLDEDDSKIEYYLVQ